VGPACWLACFGRGNIDTDTFFIWTCLLFLFLWRSGADALVDESEDEFDSDEEEDEIDLVSEEEKVVERPVKKARLG
jgi:hypothetical protein